MSDTPQEKQIKTPYLIRALTVQRNRASDEAAILAARCDDLEAENAKLRASNAALSATGEKQA